MRPRNLQFIIDKIQKYHSNPRLDFIEEAYRFAETAHAGQFRNSGEPYITHPVAVAAILAELELDQITIAAGLLHDVVEDTNLALEELEGQFGKEITGLVDGVTKLSKLEFHSKEEAQAENLRKMFLAMAKDIRVLLIKLADRLHNMRTLKHQNPRKQREIAQETLDIFAPLANRLGIFRIKWELEDLCLRYLEPQKYYALVDGISTKRHERENYINTVITMLTERLNEVNIKAEIYGRPKHFYSIFKKMTTQHKELSEIYDLIAVRIIVDNVKDCYGALGIVHTLWKPIPGRFKDFIAMPKQNMYQSLHTTVIGVSGEPFEIQIRTREMHRTAEYGIAAHWKYKEAVTGSNEMDAKMSWLRQLLEWQNDMRDAQEFMENLKIDLFDDSVFVFTPKGDVVELPKGSVPIDFAYRVHTNVGHHMIGSKVNGKIVPIDYRLVNGDIVEVLTNRNSSGPSRDWLKIVTTSQAKNRIRSWFKREKRDENIIKGRELLERECKRLGLDMAEIFRSEKLQDIRKRFSFLTLEDLFAAIGDGTLTTNQILFKFREEKEKRDKANKSAAEELADFQAETKTWVGQGKSNQGVVVKDIDNVMVRMARCCNPLPGDPIIGFITKGRGVSIHRQGCGNLHANRNKEGGRIIEVAWDDTHKESYQVKLEVDAMDRAGLLTDVMAVITELKISANSVHAGGTRNGQARVDLLLEVRSLDQLDVILKRISRVKDVHEVRRVNTV
ncbi:MAG TPA: bifunctional (p)ppGpp synthetase/guanosine-3',5'-bis(diphosphate) 3'-pyrophosphohydrolase [Bacillota bacterium]|nr:bifunctional (p)ppGpp synthetase/guanosine-3',5'-bis(diphosphate) 3'-pyrophosphohydrolase [Bacillota bacterium]